MQFKPFMVLTLALATLAATGCSKDAAAPDIAAATATAEAATAAPAPAQHATACTLVTAAEMSAIFGSPVVASAGSNERPPAATECIYETENAPPPPPEYELNAVLSPYAEVEVDWGGGDPEALGTAAGLANSAATMDAADPLKGLGDRAYKVTADQVFISTHGNLMMIRFARRSEDVAAKARKIFETAQPRM